MSARAFAPASIGNVGVGFDLLGLALAGPGDIVEATRTSQAGVVIDAIGGVSMTLPREPAKNTAGRVALALLEDAGATFGVKLTIEKGIALGSGMGGSAASAVAAAVAVNALLDQPHEHADLLDYALRGEAVASGVAHADNVAPCLLGGLVLAPVGEAVVSLPVPRGLRCVLGRPDIELTTRAGRAVLREHYTLGEWVTQAGHLASFVDACHRDDRAAIKRHLVDTLIEPQRKNAITGFDDVRAAVMQAGALACSISGSGPAMFAWCDSQDAEGIVAAFTEQFAAVNLTCEIVNSVLNAPGARLLN